VDERFTTEECDQIRQGAATWPVPIDLLFNQRVSPWDTDRRVIVRADPSLLGAAYPSAKTTTAGVNLGYTRILIVPERAVNSPLWWIVAHELGHGFRIPDLTDHKALMYGSLDYEQVRWCVTDTDAYAYWNATGEHIESTCEKL
jgi:hypothetical protein